MMKAQLFKHVGVGIILLCLLALGVCHHARAADAHDWKRNAKRLDELYSSYLAGSVTEAKNALDEAIGLLEASAFPKPGSQAHGLWLGYGRLHVLARHSGSPVLADAYLLKARYWYLRKLELSGESTETAMVTVNAFTSDKCVQIVKKWDLKHSGGKGPRYSAAVGTN
jgi:hypothetical protein